MAEAGAFRSRVIRPVFADRYRCPIDGMEYFLAGVRRVRSRLSRGNDLVRGLNSRSRGSLNGTTRNRAPNARRNPLNHPLPSLAPLPYPRFSARRFFLSLSLSQPRPRASRRLSILSKPLAVRSELPRDFLLSAYSQPIGLSFPLVGTEISEPRLDRWIDQGGDRRRRDDETTSLVGKFLGSVSSRRISSLSVHASAERRKGNSWRFNVRGNRGSATSCGTLTSVSLRLSRD